MEEEDTEEERVGEKGTLSFYRKYKDLPRQL